MLRQWFDWLDAREPIARYHYPSIGVGPGDQEWLIKIGDDDVIRQKMSVTPYKNEYVYLGGGVWGLYERSESDEFIIGGLETTDNYGIAGNNKWAAPTLNEKEKK